MEVQEKVLVPRLGLGTWMRSNEEAKESVKDALLLGYKRIDTAQAYGNEEGVGEGILESHVKREDIFVGSKIRAEYKTYQEAKASIDESLKKLHLDYLDQRIIHAPQPWNEFRGEKRYFKENKEVYRALEDAYFEGKVKVIGVSNFLIDDLENLLFSCRIKPRVNQIILHIGNTDRNLINYRKKEGIQIEAYSPIAHGEALKDPRVLERAEKYKVSPAKLCLQYALQLGAAVLPKTTSFEHRKDNRTTGFILSDKDREELIRFNKFRGYGEYGYFPVFGEKNRSR